MAGGTEIASRESLRDLVQPEVENLGELLEVPYNRYLNIKQPFEPRITRSSKKIEESINQGVSIMEKMKNTEEDVLPIEDPITELNETLPIVMEIADKMEDKIILDDIPTVMDQVEGELTENDQSSDSEFSITDSDSDTGEKSASKLEGMGGSMELQEWTPEAIVECLGPVVDRAKKVWYFINGKENDPPLNYVIPCGATEYLPEAYGLALGRMMTYLDTLVEEMLVNNMNTVMLTVKNDEPKWEKALVGDEAEGWQATFEDV